MAHGKPDWGLVGPKQTVYGLDDMGEMAARLDSPSIWDRRGDVVLMDSFECGTSRGLYNTWGGGDSYNIYTLASRHGPLSMHVHLGGLANSHFLGHWEVATTGQAVNGFEISFSVDGNADRYAFDIEYLDGVNRHRGRAQYIVGTGTLEYLNAAGAYTPLAVGLGLVTGIDPIHVLKVVADLGNDVYSRIILDETTYPLTGIPSNVFGVGGGPYIVGQFQVWNTLTPVSNLVIDRIIMTQNEPI